MHFSDQHPGPTNKKMLLFKFALPDADSMADMTRLVALIPYYIDLIGRYKLSSQVGQLFFIFFWSGRVSYSCIVDQGLIKVLPFDQFLLLLF